MKIKSFSQVHKDQIVIIIKEYANRKALTSPLNTVYRYMLNSGRNKKKAICKSKFHIEAKVPARMDGKIMSEFIDGERITYHVFTDRESCDRFIMKFFKIGERNENNRPNEKRRAAYGA